MISWQRDLLLVGAAAVAGAINSVAGGGTLLTFPALLAAGQLSTIANATNTVALWPGQVSSLWGYKNEIRHNKRALLPLGIIGIAGGLGGAQLLLKTSPAVFDRVVPFLILAATTLFIVQEPLSRWQKARIASSAGGQSAAQTVAEEDAPLRLTWGTGLFLLGIALYGGYFGAGIGILTLAALGLMGLTNIHQMNGIKALFTIGINGVAAARFAIAGIIDWRIAALMAFGSVFGGYAGSGIARRIGQKNVRHIVIGIGLILSTWFLWKAFIAPALAPAPTAGLFVVGRPLFIKQTRQKAAFRETLLTEGAKKPWHKPLFTPRPR